MLQFIKLRRAGSGSNPPFSQTAAGWMSSRGLRLRDSSQIERRRSTRRRRVLPSNCLRGANEHYPSVGQHSSLLHASPSQHDPPVAQQLPSQSAQSQSAQSQPASHWQAPSTEQLQSAQLQSGPHPSQVQAGPGLLDAFELFTTIPTARRPMAKQVTTSFVMVDSMFLERICKHAISSRGLLSPNTKQLLKTRNRGRAEPT